jgi:hypothetical protein
MSVFEDELPAKQEDMRGRGNVESWQENFDASPQRLKLLLTKTYQAGPDYRGRRSAVWIELPALRRFVSSGQHEDQHDLVGQQLQGDDRGGLTSGLELAQGRPQGVL